MHDSVNVGYSECQLVLRNIYGPFPIQWPNVDDARYLHHHSDWYGIIKKIVKIEWTRIFITMYLDSQMTRVISKKKIDI
ncbi:hypothetical protein DERF_005616 [Dermatophagoides farinae]|uniref:Uncharacterized protein n=1 Tax=Dermatophagoides farinae TaxID=6954 RepID=A0A922L8V5_DERFA|nr:hypothetical protein DERF_005616 [Dermatophagoides farinae]